MMLSRICVPVLRQVALLVSLSLVSLVVQAAGLQPALEAQGQINQIDLGEQTVTIGGRQYVPAPELKVEINGSFGAFSLLETGMRVRLRYRQNESGVRELLNLSELAPGLPLDES